MKPLYLIVHEQIITMKERAIQPEVAKELCRIKEEENFRLFKKPTSQIPKNLPRDRLIRICGIYQEICVWQVNENLKEEGYNSEIYGPGSFNAP